MIKPRRKTAFNDIPKQIASTKTAVSESRRRVSSVFGTWRETRVRFAIGLFAARLFVAAAALLSAPLAGAQEPGAMIEWPHVGAEQAHTKYSAAEGITAASVGDLEIVWQWEPNETPLEAYGTRPGPFQATPIMIGNVLYLSTMYTRVVALDAETGAELWTFDPKAYEGGPKGAGPNGFKHRGVAWWSDGNDDRIFLNSRDRLYAIAAATGELDAGFGDSGSVLLTEGHGREVTRYEFDQTSSPVVFEDLVIVGSRVPDGVQRKFDPPGTVQAFDVRTGERRWVFFTVPQSSGDFGADTWEDESWRYTGHANVWGLMSLDAERGLLYVPTSTPSSDYWGGRRVGANLFAESLVCLDARTGERRWHFQTVHHGVWDYDLSAAPNLATITVDGRDIDAVAQVAKNGFTYVFDRVTGEPVWPIEERPVDTTTDVPGEVLYATQPFPTQPPAFSRQGVSLEDANDLTPGNPRAGGGRDAAVPVGTAVHATESSGDAAAPRREGRRELGRGGIRPRDRAFVRADVGRSGHQPTLRERGRRSAS